jgi:non-canonical poly(A) RNA polymerase PAPD5/7
MNKLAKVLMKHPDYESINIIRSAKVPLIKLIESKTGYNFDISFNKLDGVKQIKEINKALEYYPEMRYVLVLMKCFLK